MSNLYIRITRPEGYEDVHPDLILQDMGVASVWGAEVVDVEAVLRECREALSSQCQVNAVHHANGEVTVVAVDAPTDSKCLIDKIDEVLK